MKAINYYVVVEQIKQQPKEKAGLIITENIDADNRYIKAKIITTGNLVEGVKVDDIVHYDKHAGHGINWKEKLYHVIRSADIVLVE